MGDKPGAGQEEQGKASESGPDSLGMWVCSPLTGCQTHPASVSSTVNGDNNLFHKVVAKNEPVSVKCVVENLAYGKS